MPLYSATLSDCPGYSRQGNVREGRSRVDVHGMPSDGADYWNAGGTDPLPEVLRRTQAIGEVVLVENLLQTDGQSLQVPPREAAVRGKAFRDHHEASDRLGQPGIPDREKTANVPEYVLLRAHQRAVAE